MGDALYLELIVPWSEAGALWRPAIRVTLAALLGGLVGIEREHLGKPAGVRTHMLVALGSALFVVGALEAGMEIDPMARVIQGLAAGVGFLGAGTILKGESEQSIRGLTTAAGIWVTAALGTAVGLGHWPIAVFTVVLCWLILRFVYWLEPSSEKSPNSSA